MSRLLQSLIMLFAIVAFSVPQSASAHAELVRSTPRAGETLASAPETVSAVFSTDVDPSQSALTVENAAGTRVDRNDLRLDAADTTGRTLLVSLQSNLAPDTYTVRWQVTAEDGHTAEGSFQFMIGSDTATRDGTATTTGTPATEPAATLPETGGYSRVIPLLAVIGFILTWCGLALRRRYSAV
jgi:copper resistance protein C